MSVVTGAAVATAVAAAASAASAIYSATNQPTQTVPAIIKPEPINLDELEAQTHDILSGNLAEANALQMRTTPGLVTGNQTAINTAYKNLTGPLDPNVEGSFATTGLASALRATGGGNPMAMVGGEGSASGNQVAKSVVDSTMADEDYNNRQFESLVSANPEPVLDITGPMAANLSAYNTQELNNFNFAKFNQRQQKDAANSGGGF